MKTNNFNFEKMNIILFFTALIFLVLGAAITLRFNIVDGSEQFFMAVNLGSPTNFSNNRSVGSFLIDGPAVYLMKYFNIPTSLATKIWNGSPFAWLTFFLALSYKLLPQNEKKHFLLPLFSTGLSLFFSSTFITFGIFTLGSFWAIFFFLNFPPTKTSFLLRLAMLFSFATFFFSYEGFAILLPLLAFSIYKNHSKISMFFLILILFSTISSLSEFIYQFFSPNQVVDHDKSVVQTLLNFFSFFATKEIYSTLLLVLAFILGFTKFSFLRWLLVFAICFNYWFISYHYVSAGWVYRFSYIFFPLFFGILFFLKSNQKIYSKLSDFTLPLLILTFVPQISLCLQHFIYNESLYHFILNQKKVIPISKTIYYNTPFRGDWGNDIQSVILQWSKNTPAQGIIYTDKAPKKYQMKYSEELLKEKTPFYTFDVKNHLESNIIKQRPIFIPKFKTLKLAPIFQP